MEYKSVHCDYPQHNAFGLSKLDGGQDKKGDFMHYSHAKW